MIQIKPDPAPYDDTHYLVLQGVDGIGVGETAKISLGESLVVGRSRYCGWSLQKSARYLKDENGEREAIRESVAFRSVSRRHCRVTYLAPDLAEVVNLSPNGTIVDGHRVDRIVINDCRRKPHRIQLGPTGDTVELHCGSVEPGRSCHWLEKRITNTLPRAASGTTTSAANHVCPCFFAQTEWASNASQFCQSAPRASPSVMSARWMRHANGTSATGVRILPSRSAHSRNSLPSRLVSSIPSARRAARGLA